MTKWNRRLLYAFALCIAGIVVCIIFISFIADISQKAPFKEDAPATIEERTCIDVLDVKTNLETRYPTLADVTGTVKSNCKYPVQGGLQLRLYDKNHNVIDGYGENKLVDLAGINLKPGQTKSYSMSFDKRILPQNDVRDPNRDIAISVEVTSYVIAIVSPEDAAIWE